MVTILLEKILTLLTGWLDDFTTHAGNVLAKLNLIEEDTDTIVSTTSDIADDTNDIKDNTASIITPINNISSNTNSIKTNTDTIKADTTIIRNNINTISTNTGSTSAYCQDIANNTLDCSNRLVTIGSDTTQIRSNSNNITADVSDIKTALNYYIGNTIVTEDSEGAICNIDTDLEDYLQKGIVTIPADLTGYSGITLTKCGKNLINSATFYDYNSWRTDIISTGDAPTSVANRGYIIPTVNGKTYSLNFGITNVDFPTYLYLCKTDGVSSSSVVKYVTTSSVLNNPITFTSDGSIYYLRLGANNSTVFNDKMSKCSFVSLENGDEVTPYEPYRTMSYPISFGSTITDGAEVDLLSGVVKINSTPVSYTSITPIAVRTYKGINNIYSDIGNTALTYRETLKHYLDKQ